MLIKLAMYSDRNQKEDIETCCHVNKVDFINLKDNIFGLISNKEYNQLYGDESGIIDLNTEDFVKIYSCAKQLTVKRSIKKNIKSPYVSYILDNRFFHNIINYCFDNNIDVEKTLYVTESGLKSDAEDREEICQIFQRRDNYEIKKLYIIIDTNNIIIDNNGYIDLSSEPNRYIEIKSKLEKIIFIGLNDSYGE